MGFEESMFMALHSISGGQRGNVWGKSVDLQAGDCTHPY